MSKKTDADIEYGTVMTEQVVRKFDEAFTLGMSDREACLYAGNIPYSTFTTWLEKNENYRTKKEQLKLQPRMKAKINVVKQINSGDTDVSKWYLERAAKDEFSLRQEIDAKNENLNTNVEVDDDDFIEQLKQKYLKK